MCGTRSTTSADKARFAVAELLMRAASACAPVALPVHHLHDVMRSRTCTIDDQGRSIDIAQGAPLQLVGLHAARCRLVE